MQTLPANEAISGSASASITPIPCYNHSASICPPMFSIKWKVNTLNGNVHVEKEKARQGKAMKHRQAKQPRCACDDDDDEDDVTPR